MKKVGYFIVFIFIVIIVIVFVKIRIGVSETMFKKLYKIYSKDETYQCDLKKVCKKTEVFSDDDAIYNVDREMYYDSIRYDNDTSYYKIRFYRENDFSFMASLGFENITFFFNSSLGRYTGIYNVKEKKMYNFVPEQFNADEKSQLDEIMAHKLSLELIKQMIELIEYDLNK